MDAELMTRNAAELTTVDTGLVDAWMDYERQDGATENTLTAYRRGLDTFASWLATNRTTPGTVTAATIRTFKSDLADQYSAQTVNLRLAAVRSFYRWLEATDRVPVNPAADVRGTKRPNSRTHKKDALANHEVVAVMDTCDTSTTAGTRDCAILSLMAYCGLRTVEIHRANINDLKTRSDRLTLDVQGKGRQEKDEFVVVPPATQRAVLAWLRQRNAMPNHVEGDPLFVSLSRQNRGDRLGLRSIRGMVKRRYQDAGVVGKKTTHSLRHSAITNAIRGRYAATGASDGAPFLV